MATSRPDIRDADEPAGPFYSHARDKQRRRSRNEVVGPSVSESAYSERLHDGVRPFDYFPRVEDFIAMLAILAAARFRDRLVEAQPSTEKDLLLARLEAYLANFSEFPNDLELVFGQHAGWSEELTRLRLETFSLLEAAVSEGAANLPSQAVKEASFDLWTAVHGYVVLERAGLISPRMSVVGSSGDERAAWIERIAKKAIRPARRRT